MANTRLYSFQESSKYRQIIRMKVLLIKVCFPIFPNMFDAVIFEIDHFQGFDYDHIPKSPWPNGRNAPLRVYNRTLLECGNKG